MQDFLIRGIPNFSHVETVTAQSVDELMSRYDCRVNKSPSFGYRGEFYSNNKRIMLYVLCTPTNKNVIQKYCNDGKGGFLLTLGDSGTIRTIGTWSIDASAGIWYMIHASNHGHYNKELGNAKKLQAIENSKIELDKLLDDQVSDKFEDALERFGRDIVLKTLQALYND